MGRGVGRPVSAVVLSEADRASRERQILATGNKNPPQTEYVSGTVTPHFLREIAQLSRFEDGPRLAREVLAKHGIALVIVSHLPRTYLDGAALRLKDGQPVVGLTLRSDRIDNFWFCLLHELAHVGRHLDNNQGNAFVDDQTLRGVEGRREDPREAQADGKTRGKRRPTNGQPRPLCLRRLGKRARPESIRRPWRS